MRTKQLQAIASLTLIALLVSEALSQRPRRFRRPGSSPATAAPTATTPKKATKKEVEQYVAITGGTVYIGTGQVLRNATVLIGDDKIEKVGPGIEIPKGAKILDAKGKFVAPGFVIVNARGMGAGSTSDNPLDSVNPFDPQIKMGLAVGITSFLQSGGSGSSKPGGTSAIHKLAYGQLEGMVLQHGTVLKMGVPLTMAQMKAFRDSVAKAKEYKAKKAEYDAKKPTAGTAATRPGSSSGGSSRSSRSSSSKAPRAPSGAEDLLAIMSGKKKLWINCRRGYNNAHIRQALSVARLLGVGVVLEDPTTAWSIADEVAAAGSMVILNPREEVARDPARPDTTGSNIAMARILDSVGVPVAVHPPSGRFGGATLGTGGILGQDLNTPHVDAAFAVRGGLDNRKGLRTITLDAARMMGAEARIGSLEPGKDADVLILDGEPLHYRSFVETALVNGRIVYEKTKQPFYRHIKR
ncbi:MAG: amidohydrolase family protein [Planctomycetota bacterium]|nr:amidohydrolase family protein [Planctomycetota bacterium]